MLSGRLLNIEYEEVKSAVELQVRSSKFLSLQLDGWSNLRNEGIINFIISTPTPYFVKSVETKLEAHTGLYLFEEIDKVLTSYGSTKFLSVITDNASNCKKAGLLIEKKYPYISSIGCMSHTLHLLCCGILKLGSVKQCIQNVKKIVKAIKRNQRLGEMFRNIQNSPEYQSKKSLCLPVKTRWGSHLTMLNSIVSNKSCLQTLAVLTEGSELLGTELKSMLLEPEFWLYIEHIICILSPIVTWVIRMENDESIISLSYSCFNDIELAIKSVLERTAMLTKLEKTFITSQMIKRKQYAIKPIHMAAHLLDPKTESLPISTDYEMEGIAYINMLSENDPNIMEDFSNFRSRSGGIWGNQFIWDSAESTKTISWWKGLCRSSPLQNIAVRILSTPPTSAATERSFSTFSSIHTKSRNRLTTERATKMTYITHYHRSNINSVKNSKKNKSKINLDHLMENEDTNNLEADDECSEGESFSSSDDSDTNDSTNNDSSESDGIIEDLDCRNPSSSASDVHITENDIIDINMEEEVTQIDTNSFVLVNFFGNTLTTKNQVFKYVCMVKSILKTGFKVQGLKSVGGSKKHFKIIDGDVSLVKITDIISKLDFPKKTYDQKNKCMIHIFSSNIDISEQ